MKNIVITGGAGFIGSHVVRLFVNKYPEYKIINLDKLTYAGNLANLKDIEGKPNYKFVKMDDLTKANFANSTIERSDFSLAQLSGATFAGAKIIKVSFLNANMQGIKIDADTKMDDVDFSGADLSNAKIEKFTAKKVIYDNKTKFPSGFDPRQYGFTKRGEKAADIKVEAYS